MTEALRKKINAYIAWIKTQKDPIEYLDSQYKAQIEAFEIVLDWMDETPQEPDELPEWAKHEINMHYSVAAKESSEIIRELNKNSPVAVGDPYFSGYLAALRWVLSLRKPEVKE